MARRSSVSPASTPPSAPHSFRAAIVRALVEATALLGSASGHPVSRRKLVNFLRGSEAPGSLELDGLTELYGLFEAISASWLHDIVDALVEHGALAMARGSRGTQGLSVDRADPSKLEAEALRAQGLFPVRPRLGSNPGIEKRLRSLRTDLAGKEGRAAYGIFPNSVLAELAAIRPGTLAELSHVSGMGEARVRKYGRKILAALAAKQE